MTTREPGKQLAYYTALVYKKMILYRPAKFYFLAILLLTSGCQSKTESFINQHFKMVELASGIYACIHQLGGKAICNAGIIDLGDETVIFDTFLSPVAAGELKNAVKALGLSPVKYVVNSHYHNDHIRGNQIFGDEAQIIASKKTAKIIREREPRAWAMERSTAPPQLAFYDSLMTHYTGDTTTQAYRDINLWRPYYQVLVEENESLSLRLPDLELIDPITLEGSRYRVRITPTETGHSQGDVYLEVLDEAILFTGDLLFKDTHPFLGEGDLDSWLQLLDEMKATQPKILVPGHGPVADVQAIAELKEYIEELDAEVDRILAGDLSLEVAQSQMPDRYQSWDLQAFYGLNLQILSQRRTVAD